MCCRSNRGSQLRGFRGRCGRRNDNKGIVPQQSALGMLAQYMNEKRNPPMASAQQTYYEPIPVQQRYFRGQRGIEQGPQTGITKSTEEKEEQDLAEAIRLSLHLEGGNRRSVVDEQLPSYGQVMKSG